MPSITGPSAVPTLANANTFHADTETACGWLNGTGGLVDQINALDAADVGAASASDLLTMVGTASNGGDVIFEEGTNSNGEYTLMASGLFIYRHRINLTYSNASTLDRSWTYPASETESDHRFFGTVYRTGFDITGGLTVLGGVTGGSIGTSSVSVAVYRIAGTTNFTSGDDVDCDVLLVGNWF